MQRVINLSTRFLTEGVMGFLALVALGTACAPLVFDVPATLNDWFNALEWVILGVFAADYLARLAIAPDRWRFVTSPWRIIDLVVIGGALLTLLPQVDDALRGTMALRILLVGRAIAFGARAGMAMAIPRAAARLVAGAPLVRVMRVPGEGEELPAAASWDDVVGWGRKPTEQWYHAMGTNHERMGPIAEALGMTSADLRTLFDPSVGARVQRTPKAVFMVITIPRVAAEGFPEVSWSRIVGVLPEVGILTATTSEADVPSMLLGSSSHGPVGRKPFGGQTMLRILELARDRFQLVVQRFGDEEELLQQVPLSDGSTRFLAQVFRLRREIAATAAELFRLGVIARHLAEGRIAIPGATPEIAASLHSFDEQLAQLQRQFADLRDDLQSLMDLHLNVKSYQMNSFMRFLAVVSFLGLIPAVAGGLLGMNILGQPWPVTLGQIVFGVAMGMAISIYVFAIRGWLR